jgi:hypothetical protein
MNKFLLLVLLPVLLLGLSACGGSESTSADYEAVSKDFLEILFAGKFEDAKAMALEGFSEPVVTGVDAFAVIYEKYDFREIAIVGVSTWSPTAMNPEGDKRMQITYQFSPKGEENWRTGMLELRALSNDSGFWGVADIVLNRPKK